MISNHTEKDVKAYLTIVWHIVAVLSSNYMKPDILG